MIGHRHIFVIGAERIVRVAPAPAIRRMVDPGKEIGELADRGRQMQRCIGAAGCSSRAAMPSAFARSAPSAASNAETRRRNAARGAGAERHQRVQRRTRGRLGRFLRLAGKQPRFECGSEIKDHVADRDPAARRAAWRAERPRAANSGSETRYAPWPRRPSFPALHHGFRRSRSSPLTLVSEPARRAIILQFRCRKRDANDRSAGADLTWFGDQ